MNFLASLAQHMRGSSTFSSQIIRTLTMVGFFLIPLFFLPWTTEVLEMNKQILFVLLTAISLVAWLGQMVLTKQFAFKSGWLNLIPVSLLVVLFVSSLLSFAGYQSWIGYASSEYSSFLSGVMYVALFYLMLNTAGDTVYQRNVLVVLLSSAALTGLITLVGMLNLVHLPFAFAQGAGFNTIGTINGFAMFMSVAMFMGLALWLVSATGRDRIIPLGGFGMFMRGLIVVVSLIALFTQVAVDFNLFWILNMVGVALLGVFVFIQSSEFPHPRRFALPLVVLLFSLIFLFAPTPLKLRLPIVVSPSMGSSFEVAKTTLMAKTTNLLFGSGPATFLPDFLAYKPVEINASQFWSLRFDRAKSELITLLATTGVIGSLLWLVLMVWVAIKALGRLLLERNHEEWKMTYVFFIGWAMLFLTHVFYSSNMTLSFLLWGMTGLLASQVMQKVWMKDFSAAPRLGLTTSFAFVFVAVFALASLFMTGSRLMAEVAFARAVAEDRKEGGSIEQVIADLNQAVKYNGWSDVYQRNLSNAYLAQARELISKRAGAQLTAPETQAIADVVGKAVASATRATEIAPNTVANWMVRGAVYRDLMSFAQGAEDLSAQMYQNTIRLEPTSPLNRVNLGRVYLNVADRARSAKTSKDAELAKQAVAQEEKLLQTAEQAFVSAIQLKNDYLPAHYYLAAVYERQGKLDQAAARLADLRNNNQTDIGVAFQLSQMLIRLKKYDLATQELERIVGINPNYSNALWYLASLYELSGKDAQAITLVKKVVELNPQNVMAQERLDQLQAGGSTVDLPEPIQEGQEGTVSVDEGEVVEE